MYLSTRESKKYPKTGFEIDLYPATLQVSLLHLTCNQSRVQVSTLALTCSAH